MTEQNVEHGRAGHEPATNMPERANSEFSLSSFHYRGFSQLCRAYGHEVEKGEDRREGIRDVGRAQWRKETPRVDNYQ